MLTRQELQRYDRQILIPEIGRQGQEKLKKAAVFIAGAGGLGSSISFYLAAAGIGTITIVDDDVVEISNLNRQILHWTGDIGARKVSSAKKKLKSLNPGIKIEAVHETITEKNIARLIGASDLIVDAMDNLETRYILNGYAVKKRLPFFHGSVCGFEGRVMTVIPGKSACLRCMYKGPVLQEKFPVIGVLPGIIGCIQATEVIKYIVGFGELLQNRLLVFDGLDSTWTELKLHRNPECDHCGKQTKE